MSAAERVGLRIPRGPLAVVLISALALPMLFGAPVADVLLSAGYELVYVAAPGVLVYLALSDRPGPLLRQVALGWALGYVLEILAFTATAALDVRGLLYAYPVLVAAVTVPLIRRRGRVEDMPEEPGPRGWPWALAGVLVVVFAYLAVAHLALTPLPSTEHTTVLHPDHPFHLSVAAEAKHHWPILDSEVAGEPRAYHVFAHIHLAAASQVTGLDLPVVYLRLYFIPLIVLFALQLVVAARAMGRSAWVGVVAAALLFLVGEIDLDPRERYAGSPFGGLFFTYLYNSPSFLLGLVFFVPALVLLYERLMADELRARWRDWALLALFLVGCGGAKVTILPVLIGALALFLLWSRWKSGRVNRSALAGMGMAAAVMGVFYVLQYRGHSSGTSLDPFASTDSMLGVGLVDAWLDGAPWPIGTSLVLDVAGTLVALAALLVAPLVGLGWWRGRSPEARHVWLLALLASSLAGFLLIDINSAFFLFYGYVAGALLSAEGLIALVAATPAAERDPGRLAWFAVAWAAFVGLVIAIPLIIWNPGGETKDAGLFFGQDVSGTRDNGALYFGWYAAVALALALLFVLARARSGRIFGLSASMVLVVAVLVLGAFDAPLDHGQQLFGKDRRASDRFLNVGMSGGLYEGLAWIRDHTDTDDVLAVNRHLGFEGRNAFLGYYYYSGFSERRVFLEDWTFAVRAADLKSKSPFPERLELGDAVFRRADPWAILALADGAGVRELVVDRHADEVSSRLADRVRLVHSNPDVSVYAIPQELPVLVSRDGREEIRGPEGEAYPVVHGDAGFVELERASNGRVRLLGWSATGAGAAVRVLVFVNNRLVAAPRTTVERPDIAKLKGPGALLAGFDLTAPSSLGVQRPTSDQVRVFGLIDGQAYELPRLGTALG